MEGNDMATIDETLADVKAGKITAAEALKQEQAASEPRSSLVTQLEALVKKEKEASEPKAGVGLGADTKNEASVAEATGSENQYETVTVKVSKKVLDNTGGQGAYTDPESKKTIGAEPVAVPATPFVEGLLRSQELVRG
jgi:hypothetical protein